MSDGEIFFLILLFGGCAGACCDKKEEVDYLDGYGYIPEKDDSDWWLAPFWIIVVCLGAYFIQ